MILALDEPAFRFSLLLTMRLTAVVCLAASWAALFGLLATWAALADRHWFARAAVVGSLMFCLAIESAFELVLIFLAETAVVAAALVGWRLWQRRRTNMAAGLRGVWNFRVADLLLLTVLVAALALLAQKLPEAARRRVDMYLIWGTACGCAVVGAIFSATRARSWTLKALCVTCVPILAAVVPANLSAFSQPAARFASVLESLGYPEWLWYPVLV
ncbi:MAG: hypothetical protein ACRD3W_27645, partial [Terriglobales bacterium]